MSDEENTSNIIGAARQHGRAQHELETLQFTRDQVLVAMLSKLAELDLTGVRHRWMPSEVAPSILVEENGRPGRWRIYLEDMSGVIEAPKAVVLEDTYTSATGWAYLMGDPGECG